MATVRRYVDNATNRRLGRVGLPMGTCVQRQEGTQPRLHVDNDMNRRLGRVGLPVGEHIHRRGEPIPQHARTPPAQCERGQNVLPQPPRFYADNDMNRRLGRVGMPLGEHVHRQGEAIPQNATRTPPTQVERGQGVLPQPPRFYANNDMNRRLGRVGMPLGEHVHRRGEPIPQPTTSPPVPPVQAERRQDGSSQPPPERFYGDNNVNRRLEHAGMPVGEHVRRRGEPIIQRTTRVPERRQDAVPLPSRRIFVDHAHRQRPLPLQHASEPQRQRNASLQPPARPVISTANSSRNANVAAQISTRNPVPSPPRQSRPAVSTVNPSRIAAQISTRNPVPSPPRRSRPAVSAANQSHNVAEQISTRNPVPSPPRRSQAAAYHADGISQRVDMAQSRKNDPISSEASNTDIGDGNVATSEPLEEQDFAPTTNAQSSTGDEKFNIPASEIQLETILGAGNIGTVYDGIWRSMRVAFKKFNFQRRSEKWTRVLELEMKSLCHLSHPNIVKLYGAVLDHGNIGIVMEYLPHSLHQAVFDKGRKFSQDEKRTIIKHVCKGLIYLHGLEITHCNLTSKNVILSDHKFAKIGSYGLGFVKSEADPNCGDEGDSNYASPEILHIRPLSSEQKKKCDVYSLGILIFEVFEAKEPYESLPKDLSSPTVTNHNMQPHILDITRSCLAVELETRPSAQQFLVKWID